MAFTFAVICSYMLFNRYPVVDRDAALEVRFQTGLFRQSSIWRDANGAGTTMFACSSSLRILTAAAAPPVHQPLHG